MGFGLSTGKALDEPHEKGRDIAPQEVIKGAEARLRSRPPTQARTTRQANNENRPDGSYRPSVHELAPLSALSVGSYVSGQAVVLPGTPYAKANHPGGILPTKTARPVATVQ